MFFPKNYVLFEKSPLDEQARSQGEGEGGFPPARLKKVKFALNIKHALCEAML